MNRFGVIKITNHFLFLRKRSSSYRYIPGRKEENRYNGTGGGIISWPLQDRRLGLCCQFLCSGYEDDCVVFM